VVYGSIDFFLDKLPANFAGPPNFWEQNQWAIWLLALAMIAPVFITIFIIIKYCMNDGDEDESGDVANLQNVVEGIKVLNLYVQVNILLT
jgi:hypothetical protein